MRFLDIFNLSELFYKKANDGNDWKSKFVPPPSKALALIRAGFFNDKGEISFDQTKVEENKDAIVNLIQSALNEDKESFNQTLLQTASNVEEEQRNAFLQEVFRSLIEKRATDFLTKISNSENLKRNLHSLEHDAKISKDTNHWLKDLYQKAENIVSELNDLKLNGQVILKIKSDLILSLNSAREGFSEANIPAITVLRVPDEESNEVKTKKINVNSLIREFQEIIKKKQKEFNPQEPSPLGGSKSGGRAAVKQPQPGKDKTAIQSAVKSFTPPSDENIDGAIGALKIDQIKKEKIKKIIKTSLTPESVACLDYLIENFKKIETKKNQTAKNNVVQLAEQVKNLFNLDFSAIDKLLKNLDKNMESFAETIATNVSELSGQTVQADLKASAGKLVSGIKKILNLQPLTIDEDVFPKASPAAAKGSPAPSKETTKQPQHFLVSLGEEVCQKINKFAQTTQNPKLKEISEKFAIYLKPIFKKMSTGSISDDERDKTANLVEKFIKFLDGNDPQDNDFELFSQAQDNNYADVSNPVEELKKLLNNIHLVLDSGQIENANFARLTSQDLFNKVIESLGGSADTGSEPNPPKDKTTKFKIKDIVYEISQAWLAGTSTRGGGISGENGMNAVVQFLEKKGFTDVYPSELGDYFTTAVAENGKFAIIISPSGAKFNPGNTAKSDVLFERFFNGKKYKVKTLPIVFTDQPITNLDNIYEGLEIIKGKIEEVTP